MVQLILRWRFGSHSRRAPTDQDLQGLATTPRHGAWAADRVRSSSSEAQARVDRARAVATKVERKVGVTHPAAPVRTSPAMLDCECARLSPIHCERSAYLRDAFSELTRPCPLAQVVRRTCARWLVDLYLLSSGARQTHQREERRGVGAHGESRQGPKNGKCS